MVETGSILETMKYNGSREKGKSKGIESLMFPYFKASHSLKDKIIIETIKVTYIRQITIKFLCSRNYKQMINETKENI